MKSKFILPDLRRQISPHPCVLIVQMDRHLGRFSRTTVGKLEASTFVGLINAEASSQVSRACVIKEDRGTFFQRLKQGQLFDPRSEDQMSERKLIIDLDISH